MRITYTPMPREDVLTSLGPHWPPLPGALVAKLGAIVEVSHGAIAVHDDEEQPGRPGYTWWVVDGLIVPQDAGPAPALPDCPLETVPAPAEESPPIDPAHVYLTP